MNASSSLHENALFQGIDPAAIDAVTSSLPRLSLTAGEILFHQGASGDDLYLLLDGLIQIFAPGEPDDVTITTFLPGAYFGEMALLGEPTRSASARAIEDSVLLPIDRTTFAMITNAHPIVFNNVNRALMERLVATTRALVDVERGKITMIAVSDPHAWKHALTYLWEAAAAIGDCNLAVMASRPLLEHGISVTAAIRSNERPAQPPPGACLTYFRYRAGTLIEARAATGAIGAMADYLRRWWRLTIVFVGHEEREWITEALPWVDRLFIVARPHELAEWQLPNDSDAIQQARRPRIEAVPVIAAPEEQSRAAIAARAAGFDTPGIYLPDGPALEAQVQDGFQHSHLTQSALPSQRGILRLARAAAGARVGLALGAGGARGLAHIGVVRYLEELGVVPDVITGTSMGALVGAGLAQGLDSYGAEKFMHDSLATNIRRLLRPAFSRRSIFSAKGLVAICRWVYGKTTFDDLVTPMAIIATDLVTGRGVALRRGSIARAVQASVTIPGIFPPVIAGPFVLVDGGVCEPVPTAALSSLGADITISVNISVTPDDMERWAREEGTARTRRAIRSGALPNILDTYMATINIAVAERAQNSSRAADVAIRPRFRSSSWKEFSEGPEHLRRGHAAAVEAQKELERVISWIRTPE